MPIAMERGDFDPLAQDSDDPQGVTSATAGSPEAQAFERDFHTVDTWHVPLIVSAGEDGKLGLLEPHDTAQFGRLAQPSNLEELQDNVSSQMLRAGGR